MMKTGTLVLLSTACAAGVTLTEALGRQPVTRPDSALTAQDTIIALSIREAVVHGIPDFTPRRQVVVQAVRSVVSSRSLPPIDSVSFFLLDSLQIGELAARVGNFMYLRPFAPTINGDTAANSVASRLGFEPGTVRALLVGGACSWRFARRSGYWVTDTVIGCIIW